MTEISVNYLTPHQIAGQIHFIDYKTIGLNFGNSVRFQLCTIMYGSHKKITKDRIMVDMNSFDQRNSKMLNYCLEDIVFDSQDISIRPNSIISKLQNTRAFIVWAYHNSKDLHSTKEKAREAYEEYTLHLKQAFRSGELSSKTIALKQASAFALLRSVFDDKSGDITSGVDRIKRTDSDTNKTTKSEDSKREYAFMFYTSLFEQLADFVLDFKEYPSLLKLPSNELWLFPAERFVRPPGASRKNLRIGFCYETGRLHTINEIKNNAIATGVEENTIKGYAGKLRDAKEVLNFNNANNKTPYRLKLSIIGTQAYFMHFLTVTGMNDSTASQLLWSSDFSVERKRHKFRTIKYRAGGKVVEFEIQSKFVPYFEKFIKLREYILDGESFNNLFFVAKDYRAPLLSPYQINGGYSSSINNMVIKSINKSIPRINSRQLRVNNTHYIIKKHGVIAASQLAQSSIGTIVKSYTGESEKSSLIEMGMYFKELNKKLFVSSSDSVDIPTGSCKNYNNPSTDINLESLSIDCKQQEGCLFCKHFAIHPDEKDIRKIYSFEYVIKQSMYVSNDEDHFSSVFGAVLSRIDDILAALLEAFPDIKNISALIKDDVYKNENLTDYWEYKLSTLYDMGVLK